LSPRARSLYLDRPSARRRSSSYSSGSSGGGVLRKILWTLVALVVVIVGVGILQLTRAVPRQHAQATMAASVTVPGQAAQLPWPHEGQAAVAVGTVGMVGSVGGSASVPIASLAKMMTAYQVLTDHPLSLHTNGPSLTVTSADVADYRTRAHNSESVLAVRAGERLTEYQALQAMLIPSANNVAALLARWDAGSVPAFVARMNATAKKLGLTGTHYTDPAGQLGTTVSTAVDQLVIAQKAMQQPVFADIVAQPAATFPVAGKVFNFNYFIGHYGFVGIKTGSNAAAGGCWAFAAQRTVAGKPAVVYGVVLGQHGRNGELIQPALLLGRKLADAVPRVVQQTAVVAAGTRVGALTAPWRKPVPLVTKNAITLTTVPGQRFTTDLRLTTPASRGVAAGTQVGTLSVGGLSTPVVVASAAPDPTLKWRLTRL
jgi:D-alanyl-D-alanine carboxypeptidase (penicillin-binding protein 5/6)